LAASIATGIVARLLHVLIAVAVGKRLSFQKAFTPFPDFQIKA
jgi:hypothetical protein